MVDVDMGLDGALYHSIMEIKLNEKIDIMGLEYFVKYLLRLTLI